MAAGFPPGGHARCNARRFPVPGAAGLRWVDPRPRPSFTGANLR